MSLSNYLRKKAARKWDVEFSLGIIRTIKNWPSVLLEDRKSGNALSLYVLRNGVKYHARPKTADRDIVLEVWRRRCYTPEGFEIGPDDTVIDIGAHIGVFAVFAAHHTKRGKVVAVEPFEENFRLLSSNLELNGATNAIAINKAVSDRRGRKDLFLANANTGGHSLIKDFGRSSGDECRSCAVETLSFADLLDETKIQSVEFLKVDCEGAEYEILYACSKDTLAKVKRISMEYHDLDGEKRNASAMKSFLEGNGFSVRIESDGSQLLFAWRR
jgi:FkbM family methyltransferase